MMFVSFHTACCLAALFMQTAIKAGIDAESVDRAFLIPGVAVLVPFLIWCFIVDMCFLTELMNMQMVQLGIMVMIILTSTGKTVTERRQLYG